MNNTQLTSLSPGQSPFDSIRRFDENGREYWKARELMRLMGYAQWRNFHKAIAKAEKSMKNTGLEVSSHIVEASKMVKRSQGGGRSLLDYRLSRHACHLIAQNGDPDKPEVAASQAYFSWTAMQVQKVIPAQSERIRELELQLELAKTHQHLIDRSEAIVIMHGAEMLALILGKPDAVVPVVEKHFESCITDSRSGRQVSFEGMSLAQLAKRLNFKSGTEFKKWLEKIGRVDVIAQGLRAVQSEYIPSENIEEVKQLYRQRFYTGERQMFIGELGFN